MHNALLSNYESHPAFRFDSPAWRVSASVLSNFEQSYRCAERYSHLLDKRSFQALRRSLRSELASLFAELRAQGEAGLEHEFLQELDGETTRLLLEHLAWFRRSRSQRFAALDRAHGIDAATQMTSYRYFISSLDAPAVRQLQGIAEPTIQQFRQRASSGRRRRDELSVNHGPTTGALRACLDAAFDSNGTLAAVSAYAEAPMRVTGLALELSVADSPWWAHAMPGHEPPSTLYAHVDETISCPKAIVYLSDVATGQGETSFYPAAYEALGLGAAQQLIGRVVSNVGNDHNSGLASFYKKPYHQSTASPDFRRHFMRLPAALRFNSHLGWDVQAGSRLETELASREKTMLGPAGTFVAFDGSQLLHRGGMVRSGERIALQVMFGPDDWRRRAARLARRVRW